MWVETPIFMEYFEPGSGIIYGTGKKYGDGWLYGVGPTAGGTWLRPVWTPTSLITEDVENADWTF